MVMSLLASRLFNRPSALDVSASLLAVKLLGGSSDLDCLAALNDTAGLDAGHPQENGLYTVIDGVAIISIRGILLQRVGDLGWLYEMFGIVGYDRITCKFCAAQQDPEVEAIALVIDSPGGEVAGCFDLVDTMVAARGDKPIWAILAENAFSAGYAIASAADHITVPRTGGTGSVGVIAMHVDMSQALSNAGINVTIIQYGARKADGSDVTPLSKEARRRFQADIDAMGDLFVATVARNRGLRPSLVRGTEAATYLGAAGVAIGFADAVMAPDDALRSLLAELG